MDPLSTLGIAAAVVQFVDFGQRLLSETWQVYRSASGIYLELHELSVVSQDLNKIARAVRQTLGQQTQKGLLDTSPFEDNVLPGVCDQCDAIAHDVENILLQIDGPFKKRKSAASIGDAFRKALRMSKKEKEIDDLKQRLNSVRQQMIMATISSIWQSLGNKSGWETQFSNKLDNVIETLHQAVEKTVDAGPGRPTHDENQDDSQKRRAEGIGSIEETVLKSAGTGKVAKDIISRLWNKDWKPDPAILSTLPPNVSPADLNTAIRNSLSFNGINNREEAISKTFASTYNWVFQRLPALSNKGEPMWSSLPDWLESGSRLPYWITGKPGAGKSTAMKYIANHPIADRYLSVWANAFPLHKIKYYAWKPGMDLGKSEEGLLRTLLYQALGNNPELTGIVCPRRWTLSYTVRKFDPDNLPLWSKWELHESLLLLLDYVEDKMRLILFVDGLDEFDMAPMELCSLIQRIAGHNAIKVCVASRPWPQFSDAFAHSPGIQMHLLTSGDISEYTFGSFKGIRAFSELNLLYQNGGNRLLQQLVTKSDGVFLWTTIVIKTIFESLIEGASLLQLQTILDRMPPEIQDLYDAIYLTIPQRLLPEVSAMFQIFVSARKPMHWKTLWLADETRGVWTSIDLQMMESDQALVALKRRLGARTRGLLEVVESTQTIEFLHRTSAEWVTQPRVWEQLLSASPPDFDPHMCLLCAELIDMQDLKDNQIYSAFDLWRRLSSSLLYACLVDNQKISVQMLVDTLDQLHQAASKCFSRHLSASASEWPALQQDPGSPHSQRVAQHNSFDGLTVQFAILPYVRYKLEESPADFHLVPITGSKGLLEQAIFGIEESVSALRYFEGIQIEKISSARRLETLAYLLSNGIREANIAYLMNAQRNRSLNIGDNSYLEYLNDVEHLLRCHHAFRDGKVAYAREKFNTRMRKWFGWRVHKP